MTHGRAKLPNTGKLASMAAATLAAAATATPVQADTIWAWNQTNRDGLDNGRDRISQANIGGDSSNELIVSYQHYRAGSNRGTVPLVTNRALSGSATDATLSYMVYFPTGFRWGAVDGSFLTQGGKFMGLGPTQVLTGCNNSTNPDRWSARVGWEPTSSTTVKFRLYYYPFDRNSSCGTTAPSAGPDLVNNKWYSVKLRVSLGDTVGTDLLELYVDNVMVSQVPNLSLRGANFTDASKISTFMFNTLIGTSRDATDPTLGAPYELYMDTIQVTRAKP